MRRSVAALVRRSVAALVRRSVAVLVRRPVAVLVRRPVAAVARCPVAAFAVSVSTLLAAAGGASGQAPPAADDPVAAQIARAARAYEQGNCAEVLAAYGALQNPEQALEFDGIAQYRWGFCLALQGRDGASTKYEQAAATLGFETATPAARLEAYFYRTNALLNLRRADEARATAQSAVDRYRNGTLTVPADDAPGWFQLGKLFRDAGDPQGALDPFRRALDAHAKGAAPLRSAYLERISELALQQKDLELARRASTALAALAGSTQISTAQEARILLAGGDLDGALAAFEKAGKGQGDLAMDAQYAAAATRRALELKEWGLPPATQAANGRAIAELPSDELQAGLRESGHAALQLMETGRTIEVPRRKGIGSRPAPLPEHQTELRRLQAQFTGLLLDAIRRQAPLQVWAVGDGYAPLIHNPWNVLYVQRAAGDRDKQLLQLTPLQ